MAGATDNARSPLPIVGNLTEGTHMHGMLRSVVFTCLLDVMPEEFGQLEQAPRDLAGLVITDVCQMVESERWTDTYAGCQAFARRVTPPDNRPGYLTRYAEVLLAQSVRSTETTA